VEKNGLSVTGSKLSRPEVVWLDRKWMCGTGNWVKLAEIRLETGLI